MVTFTDPETGEGQICMDLGSSTSTDELQIKVNSNATVPQGESLKFNFYYSINGSCITVPQAPESGPRGPSIQPIIMDVVCYTGLAASRIEDQGTGLLLMTPTTATAMPGQYFFFSCNGHVLFYETQLSDTQYVTTMGVCTYGETCTSNDGHTSWSVAIIDPSAPTNVSTPTGPFINFEGAC